MRRIDRVPFLFEAGVDIVSQAMEEKKVAEKVQNTSSRWTTMEGNPLARLVLVCGEEGRVQHGDAEKVYR